MSKMSPQLFGTITEGKKPLQISRRLRMMDLLPCLAVKKGPSAQTLWSQTWRLWIGGWCPEELQLQQSIPVWAAAPSLQRTEEETEEIISERQRCSEEQEQTYWCLWDIELNHQLSCLIFAEKTEVSQTLRSFLCLGNISHERCWCDLTLTPVMVTTFCCMIYYLAK